MEFSFTDKLFELYEHSLNSALKEYVEGGRYRIDKGLAEGTQTSLSKIIHYTVKVLGVCMMNVVFQIKFIFSVEGADEVETASSVCSWNILLRDNGLDIGEIKCGQGNSTPEWMYDDHLLPVAGKGDYYALSNLFIKKVYGMDLPTKRGYELVLDMVKRLGLEDEFKEEIRAFDRINAEGGYRLCLKLFRNCFFVVFDYAAYALKSLYPGGLEEKMPAEIKDDIDSVAYATSRYLMFSPEELLRETGEKIKRYIFTRMTRLEMLNRVLNEARKEYKVPLSVIRQHLIKRGRTEFIGIKAVMDKRRLESYVFSRGSLEENETFDLPKDTMDKLFSGDERIRSLVLNGEYIYVDSHLVLNNSRYIKFRNPVTPYLSEYACLHADECFMKFRVVREMRKTNFEFVKFSKGRTLLCTGPESSEFFMEYEPVIPLSESSEVSDEKREALALWTSCGSKGAGMTLKKIMEMRNVTPDIFSDEERVTPGFIRRICNFTRSPGMKTVMTIAGKLEVPYEILPWFTELFGWHFFSNKPDMKPYLDALNKEN